MGLSFLWKALRINNLEKKQKESQNTKFMKYACEIAEKNVLENGGGPFGCIIVDLSSNEIIGEGCYKVSEECDPSAHAEINAIRMAAVVKRSFMLSDCAIYTTCEPCPMCMSAIYWSRIPLVYYGNTRDDATDFGLSDKFIYEELIKSPENRTKTTMMNIERDYAKNVFIKWEQMTKNT